jgi:hypothetical protein
MQEHPNDDEWAAACSILEQEIPSMVLKEDTHGPFPRCHLDFHHGNILLDKDFNVVTVVDWSWAQTVPLERYSVIPEFIQPPKFTAEQNVPRQEFCTMFFRTMREKEHANMAMCGAGTG